jgi:8-oxo-dGTP diphosphatase
VSLICEQLGAELLLNLSEKWVSEINLKEISFSGFHVDSKSLMKFSKRPKGELFSASCHTEKELEQALQLKADFVVLSPVQKTSSHPDMKPIGWDKFSALTENISVPVYALGGVSEADLYVAQEHGAQGVAAISAFWHE